jgi:altronate hydrolase
MSGITANPALGAAVDILAAGGGIGILSETTEIYGAEHLLAYRAATPEIAEKLGGYIKWWEDHTAKHGASIVVARRGEERVEFIAGVEVL